MPCWEVDQFLAWQGGGSDELITGMDAIRRAGRGAAFQAPIGR